MMAVFLDIIELNRRSLFSASVSHLCSLSLQIQWEWEILYRTLSILMAEE